MQLETITTYLDNLLNIDKIEDSSLNGLQVSNSGHVVKIAVAVDASLASFKMAADQDCDLLVVHHGLFWGKPLALCGTHYQRIKFLMEHDIALYAAHLPLDMHPELGNNARIAAIMGWQPARDFGDYHGITIGKEVELEKAVPLSEIVDSIKEKLNTEPHVWDYGPTEIKRFGFVSGGALSMLPQAIDRDFDLYITGEPGHSAFWNAKEEKINVILAGHYATETPGVRAVAKKLEKKFDIETVFLDLPTGY